MRAPAPLPRHVPVTARGRALLLTVAGAALFSACASATGPDALTYRITAGACGEVVFAEAIAQDSASAFAVVEARKVEQYGAGEVTVEAFPLEVVDERGRPPAARFYALRVLQPGTGVHLHSVQEVITTAGDLFELVWCPD